MVAQLCRSFADHRTFAASTTSQAPQRKLLLMVQSPDGLFDGKRKCTVAVSTLDELRVTLQEAVGVTVPVGVLCHRCWHCHTE